MRPNALNTVNLSTRLLQLTPLARLLFALAGIEVINKVWKSGQRHWLPMKALIQLALVYCVCIVDVWWAHVTVRHSAKLWCHSCSRVKHFVFLFKPRKSDWGLILRGYSPSLLTGPPSPISALWSCRSMWRMVKFFAWAQEGSHCNSFKLLFI